MRECEGQVEQGLEMLNASKKVSIPQLWILLIVLQDSHGEFLSNSTISSEGHLSAILKGEPASPIGL